MSVLTPPPVGDQRPVDVSAYIGQFPYRHLPHPNAEVLVKVLAREGIRAAWVGHLPSAFHRDPSGGNESLYDALAEYRPVLSPAPTVRPDWPGWTRALRDAADRGVAAVRAYPQHYGLAPHDRALTDLAGACGEAGLVLVLTVRFEDLRQRHALDIAGDLPAATVRGITRASVRARVVVTGAGSDFIQEVHWGLTPDEQSRVWYDFAWVWGPPEDQLATLFRTIGSARFVYGTHWPLRLAQNPRANLDLLPETLQAERLADADGIVAEARAASRSGAAAAG